MNDDPLVIMMHVKSCEIRRLLINNGISFDLIHLTTLEEMRVVHRDYQKRVTSGWL